MTNREEVERWIGVLTTKVFQQYLGLYERLPSHARQGLIEHLDLLRVMSQGLFIEAETRGPTKLDDNNGFSWEADLRQEQYLQYTQGLTNMLRGRDVDALQLLQRHEYLASCIALGMLDRQFLLHHERGLTVRYHRSDSHIHKESSDSADDIESFVGRPDRRNPRHMPFTMVGVGRNAVTQPVLLEELLERYGLRCVTAKEAMAYAEALYPGERYGGQWKYDRLELVALGDAQKQADGGELRFLTLSHLQRQLGWTVEVKTCDSQEALCIGGIGKNRFLLAVPAHQEVL